MELSDEYLRGIELFNEQRYFDCHETLEPLWLNSAGVRREFLQAIIQVAAALHQLQRGNRNGANSIYRRAKQKLESVPDIFMRLDIKRFLADVDRFFIAAANSGTILPSAPYIHLTD